MEGAAATDGFTITSQELQTDNPETVFQLIDKLGEGSYGAVYKGIHKRSGTIVALKIVPIDHDLDELQKEITVMQDCSSNAIVRFYGSFMYKESLWMAIEYCAAGSLADVMRLTRRTMSEAEIGSIVKQLLVGLDYLHKRKKIHRDIKAGNVLLTDKCEAKLADFGVAGQLSDAIVKRNTVIGTPFWMAPEIIQEVGYGCEADIWSLGITCIELADGRPPYYNIHPMRAIFIIPVKPPPTLENPKLFTADFNQFISRCLTKNPSERPSAAALMQEPFIQKAHPKNILTDRVKKVLDLIMQGALSKSGSAEESDGGDEGGDGEMHTIHSTQRLPQNSSVLTHKVRTQKMATIGEKFSTMIVNDDEPTQSNSTMMARAVAELKGNPFTTIKPSTSSGSIEATMIKKVDAPPAAKPAWGTILPASRSPPDEKSPLSPQDDEMFSTIRTKKDFSPGGAAPNATIKPAPREPPPAVPNGALSQSRENISISPAISGTIRAMNDPALAKPNGTIRAMNDPALAKSNGTIRAMNDPALAKSNGTIRAMFESALVKPQSRENLSSSASSLSNATIKPPPPLSAVQTPPASPPSAPTPQSMRTATMKLFETPGTMYTNTMYSQATLKPRAAGNEKGSRGFDLKTLRTQYGTVLPGPQDPAADAQPPAPANPPLDAPLDPSKAPMAEAIKLLSSNLDQTPPPPPALVKSTTQAAIMTPEQREEESLDQLNELLSMLEKTMESEIQQIRVKYDKKRAPVIDAINAKK